jgi:pimeloyl-ACP methyl ester carboxylesterase
MGPVSEGQLYCEVEGEGEPLVLIHGGVVTSRMWDDQFAVFVRSYRVARYDRRGHGYSLRAQDPFSPVEDLGGVLSDLDMPRAILVGSSAGGGLALDFALCCPDRVRALVLAAPSLDGFEESAQKRRNMEPLRRAVNEGNAEHAISLLMVNPYFAPLREHPKRGSGARLLQHNIHVFSPPSIPAIRLTPPAIERLSEVAAPTLVLGADQDDQDNLAIVDLLARRIPGARREIIPHAAHLMNMDQPEVFNRLVLDFLASLPPDELSPTPAAMEPAPPRKRKRKAAKR